MTGLRFGVLQGEVISIHALRVEGDAVRLVDSGKKSISIHALRVEGDDGGFSATLNLEYFYPRPPGGGRRRYALRVRRPRAISIHALRVEGDNFCFVCSTLSANFYPRPPGGGRRVFRRFTGVFRRFLSTPSGWRATAQGFCFPPKPPNFYPRPPGGGRHTRKTRINSIYFISIHALRVEGDRKNKL